MIVVLDTSAFGEDLGLRGSAIRLLTAQGRNAGLSFSVPRVVVDELVGRFTKRLEREQTKRKSTTDNLVRVLPERNPKPNLFGDSYTDKLEELTSRLQESDSAWPEANQLRAEYENWLQGVLDQNGWTVHPYPSTSHESIARRAIYRVKPFSEGGSGYRDALIWETVLEIFAESDDTIVFVTNNSKDFANADDVLHGDLESDIDAGGHARDRFQLLNSVDQLVDRYVKPVLEHVNGLATRIMRGDVEGFDLYEDLFVREDFLLYHDLDPFDLDLEFQVETVMVTGVYGVDDVEVSGARRVSQDLVLVSGSAKAEVELEGTIFKADFYAMEDHT